MPLTASIFSFLEGWVVHSHILKDGKLINPTRCFLPYLSALIQCLTSEQGKKKRKNAGAAYGKYEKNERFKCPAPPLLGSLPLPDSPCSIHIASPSHKAAVRKVRLIKTI